MLREAMVFLGLAMQAVGAVYVLMAVVMIAADVAERVWR